MSRTVLSVVSTLAQCGPVNVLHGIVRHYAAERYRAVVATLSPEPENSRAADFRALGVQVESLNLSRAAAFVVGRRRLAELGRAVAADVIHCHGVRADLLASRLAHRWPVVSTIHSDLHADYGLAYGGLLGYAMARREYAALRRMAASVAVSASVAAAAAAAGVRAQTIPNGVDVARYVPPKDSNALLRLRDALGWPHNRTILLHSGVLIALKRPLEVIDAFQSAKLGGAAMLVFAGDGPLRKDCERRANGSGNIRFLGHCREISALLGAADLLVSNSSAEGMPLALLEACASGLPILASDIPAHRDLQRLFPSLVRAFRAGDADELALELAQAARPRDVQHDQPSPQSLEEISDRTMSLRYQKLYDQVI